MNFPFRIFLFPLIYVGMGALIWFEIWRGFGVFWANFWGVFSIITISWAMVVRFIEFETPFLPALIGYMYLPFTGLTFMLLAVFEITDYLSGRAITRNFSAQRVILFIFIIVIALLAYGYYEAVRVRVKEIDIPTDKLPPDVDLVRVVQISDLHIGKTFGKDRLEQVMQLAGEASPDVVVLTGDTVDANLSKRDDLAKLLGSINPPLGKFAVTGNHEHYAGFERSIEFLQKADYDVLRMLSQDLGSIIIAGVDDSGSLAPRNESSLKLLHEIGKQDKFLLFMQHQPYVHKDTIGYFDLQLSGHTHGGQIFPFGLITYLIYGYPQGLSALQSDDDESLLYISNGTGFWGPPVRIFTPPEITIFNVVRKP